MKRIAFIDTAYHRETRSSGFLIDFLSPFFDIDIYWDESKMGGSQTDATVIERENYDIVFIFQTGTNLNFYSQINCRSIVAIPNVVLNETSVDDYFPKKFKYLALSKAQHETLASLGRNSAWFQYYPNPYDFNPSRDYASLKGFHWCRSPEVSPAMIYELMADAKFFSLHIHDAAIPGASSLTPAESPSTSIHVSYSKWLADHRKYLRILSDANVFFAPRLYEVIPHAILEAMSLGMCVVAPDLPSANEYIQNGENGLLYEPDCPLPLDFENAEAVGQNARKSIELGFDRWLERRQELFEYLTGTPLDQWDWSEALAPQFTLKPASSELIAVTDAQKRAGKGPLEGGKRLAKHEKEAPLLTVATVVRNSESNLEGTIKGVLGQTFDDFEYIIIDGMSSDGTIDIIQQYDSLLDYWVSEKDEGPYQAMSKAVKLARGAYIVFMNAGDWFASPQVLERVFANLSERPDIVYGDHIWLKNGAPHFHKSLPFSALRGLLWKGKNSTAHWYQGLPNHQSTFVKTALLRERPYDTKYKIAADYDFLFETACKGARFLQVDLLISVYQAGGMSSQNEQRCHKEWKQIFSKYGNDNADNAVDCGSNHHDFAQYVPSPILHRSKFSPSTPAKTSMPQGITGRLAALAAVNECARVYLTTPCLNVIDTIDQTILSVVSQCGDNFALRYHVQDGGSTDGTVERLMEWDRILSSSHKTSPLGRRENVIFSYASEPDSGMYEAITRGFDCMEVPYAAILSWINADDILFQGAIATLVKIFLKYPKAHWVTGHNCLLSSNIEVIGYNDEATPSDYIRAGFCEGQNWRFVQQEGTFFRKWLWDIAGGFDGNLKYAADWDLWRRFAAHAELVHFLGPIAAFRLRRGQISANENNYMDEIDTVVPSAKRSKAARQLTAETGKDLKIASICFRNNRFSLEDKPLSNFRIPHAGRKLFKIDYSQEVKELDSSPLSSPESTVTSTSTTSPGFGLRRGKWSQSMKLQKSGLFYEQYYADQVADTAESKMALVEHYLLYGGWEDKDPNPMFSSNFYLSKYNDVYLSGMNPLLHYILHGWKEGRDPHPEFSTERYLSDYEDVRKNGMNPLLHYLLHGILEGREIHPGT